MTTSQLDVLFKPFNLKTLHLKNRIVMAPMTRSHSPEGVPGDDVAAYYRRRADAEVGLIISEGTVIDRPASRNDPGIPFFHGEDALAGWKKVVDGVHQAGGKMAPQIWHVGSAANPYTQWTPAEPVESPSGLVAPDKPRRIRSDWVSTRSRFMALMAILSTSSSGTGPTGAQTVSVELRYKNAHALRSKSCAACARPSAPTIP